MKTRILFSFFVFSLILMVISCKKSSTTDNSITPEEAKVEMRAASQQLTTEMNTLMQIPAVVTLQYLSTLTSAAAMKSTVEAVKGDPSNLYYHKVKEIFRSAYHVKSTQIDFLANPGIYQFNFQTDEFDLIEPSTNLIKMIFPANQQAYTNQLLNAELTADNLQFTDSIPTNANLALKIDLVTVMTGTYNCTISSSGTPTAITLNLTMAPYTLQMNFSGSGINYTSTMSLKLNNVEILGYNMNLKYTSDMTNVEKVSGNLLMPPLKFEGWVNAQAMQIALADSVTRNDVAYLNTQMSVLVFQTVLDVQLGSLAFKLFTVPETGKQSPQIAMVYSDGTWEWLANILNGTGTKSISKRR